MIESDKALITSAFDLVYKIYLRLNQLLVAVWAYLAPKIVLLVGKIFKSQIIADRIAFALKELLSNPATALFLNTVLFWFVGSIFGGLIEFILMTLSGINIIIFCFTLLRK